MAGKKVQHCITERVYTELRNDVDSDKKLIEINFITLALNIHGNGVYECSSLIRSKDAIVALDFLNALQK